MATNYSQITRCVLFCVCLQVWVFLAARAAPALQDEWERAQRSYNRLTKQEGCEHALDKSFTSCFLHCTKIVFYQHKELRMTEGQTCLTRQANLEKLSCVKSVVPYNHDLFPSDSFVQLVGHDQSTGR